MVGTGRRLRRVRPRLALQQRRHQQRHDAVLVGGRVGIRARQQASVQVAPQAGMHAHTEAQAPRRDAFGQLAVRIEISGIGAEYRYVAVDRRHIHNHTVAGIGRFAAGQHHRADRPSPGHRTGRMQPQALVYAALQKQPVRCYACRIGWVRGAPAKHVVEGVGGGVGRAVRTSLQVKRDLAHHQVGRQFDPVLVLQ